MSKGRPIQTISALEKFYNKATENARKTDVNMILIGGYMKPLVGTLSK